MPSTAESAREYFDRAFKEWESLYSGRNLLSRTLDKLLRPAVFDRYGLALEKCGDISEKTILDIGCGAGFLPVELACRGARRVVGVDFAPSMIQCAQDLAQKMDVTERCEFVCDDFSTHPFNEKFDIVLAMGLFDYVAEPERIMSKIAGLTKSCFMASFPVNGALWRLQRHIRYSWIKRCPVYEYSAELVAALLQESSFSQFDLIPLRRGLFAIARNLEQGDRVSRVSCELTGA